MKTVISVKSAIFGFDKEAQINIGPTTISLNKDKDIGSIIADLEEAEKDAEILFNCLYHSLPSATFELLQEKFNKYE